MRRRLRAIRWSEEEWEAVRDAAAERDLTVSEYVRRTALGRADVSRDDRRAMLRQLGKLGNKGHGSPPHASARQPGPPGERPRLAALPRLPGLLERGGIAVGRTLTPRQLRAVFTAGRAFTSLVTGRPGQAILRGLNLARVVGQEVLRAGLGWGR